MSAGAESDSAQQLRPVKEDRLKMLRGAARRASTASDLRRRVSDLQSTNEMLLAFLGTLPPAQLKDAPRELRAILPSSRPHTVLPMMDSKRSVGSSPPADASPDAPPALSDGILPALMKPRQLRNESTPQPEAKKQQAGELRRAVGAAEAGSGSTNNRDHAVSKNARDLSGAQHTTAATPSSEIKLLSSQKVPQLNMHSLDELRKDLFSPATAAAQGLSGTEPPRDSKGVEIDDTGHLLNSTMLSPVVESRAKQTSRTPERNLRVIIPKQDSVADTEEMLTPLKQARLRAREAETEAGASLSSLATPLKSLLRRTPVSANRNASRALDSPGGATKGGGLAPTPTRQRAAAAGRQTPDNRTRMTPKGGRLTPTSSGGGLITPVRNGSSPAVKQAPKDSEELQQDISDRLQKSKKGSRSAKSRKGPARDCFMSRNGNIKTRPGTLVDSGEEAASLRKVADERIKKADERHKQILKERQEKAARNAERIKRAEKRKAELMKKEAEAANPSNGLGTMRAAPDAPKGHVRNNDEIPVTENHRGQTRQMTDDEQQWRQQQLSGVSARTESVAVEDSAENIERMRWEAEEMARVASVRERNSGLRPELAPAGGPRRGVPGGGSLTQQTPGQQSNCDATDNLAVPDEYLLPSTYERRSVDDCFDLADGKIEAAPTMNHKDGNQVNEEAGACKDDNALNTPSESSCQRDGATSMMRLRSQWNELEFLLRGKIDPHPEAYASALQHVEDGRAALLELSRLGRKLDVRAGALLQWVLPFDNNTSIYAQWDVAEQEEDREQSEETRRFAAEVGEGTRGRLRGRAAKLRELVRVKLADDSDLEQGLSACDALTSFFDEVAREARGQHIPDSELFARITRITTN